jgi:putative peptidoglycan lipid II flippase
MLCEALNYKGFAVFLQAVLRRIVHSKPAKPEVNLLKAAFSVSSWTFLSRITGLLRETLMAAAFGAGAVTDAFNVAFRLPNLLRRLFAEGAFSQAFVPLLGQARASQGDAAAQALIDHTAAALLWAVGLVAVLGVVGAPVLVWAIGSGLQGQAFTDATVMTRIMFPYIACMSLVALGAAVLNTWRKFMLAAATPVLLNVAVIVGIVVAPRVFDKPIYGVAAAVMVGGLLQIGCVWIGLKRLGTLPHLFKGPLTAFRFAGVKRVLALMGPALLGVSVAQISLIINTQIATHLGEGRVTWITLADRLLEFPSALLGVALGVVLTPSLTRVAATGTPHQYSALLDWGLRLTLLLALPAALGMALLAEPLTAMLYHYGKFSETALHQTAAAVQAYAIGVVGFILVKVLAPGFYARQDMKSPLRIAIAVLVATQIMNFFLVPHLGHVALALSISLGALLNAALLFWGLRHRGQLQLMPGWGVFLAKLAVALAAMAVALLAVHYFVPFAWAALQAQWLLRIGLVMATVGVAAAVYFAALFVLGFRLQDFKRTEA